MSGYGLGLLVILFFFGLAGGSSAGSRASSFTMWFLISFCVPFIGLLTAVLYRYENQELRRECPRCHRIVKLYDAVCMRCGYELEFPDVAIAPERRAVHSVGPTTRWHSRRTQVARCTVRQSAPAAAAESLDSESAAARSGRAATRALGKEASAMRAVDALMECLKAEGVDVVFGLPGGANLPTYDAFYDAGIRHILVRHEAGGGHAAEGYAKATGKVGVSLGTSGPGATNLVTPICDAMMDSVPVVFLTGQVRTELLGTDGFQEADTIGITMPIVKHSVMIQHPLELPRAIHEAFHIARTGRPGPVVVDIPTGSEPRRHPVRADHRRPPARLPADDRRQPEADPAGGQGAGQRAAAGDLRGRRRRSAPQRS